MAESGPVNAFSVDVEDWYQVSDFEAVVAFDGMRTAGRRGFSMHYVGLRGTESKLRRLLRDFRFAPVRDVLGIAA